MTRDTSVLRKFVAPEFVSGSDARLLTGEYVKNTPRDPCMATNPRQLTVKDIERIYEEAL